MKVTQKEWRVLSQVLDQYADDKTVRSSKSPHAPTVEQVVASNLVARFRLELGFPKNFRP